MHRVSEFSKIIERTIAEKLLELSPTLLGRVEPR